MSTPRLLVIILGAWLVAVAATLPGCSAGLAEEDLGEVLTETGQLPGAGEKYPLPEPIYWDEGSPASTSPKPKVEFLKDGP